MEPESGPRFVTIEHFWKDMLGMKSRGWFYSHQHDPDMPQRVMVGDKPMLVHDECVAYMEKLMKARERGGRLRSSRGRRPAMGAPVG